MSERHAGRVEPGVMALQIGDALEWSITEFAEDAVAAVSLEEADLPVLWILGPSTGTLCMMTPIVQLPNGSLRGSDTACTYNGCCSKG